MLDFLRFSDKSHRDVTRRVRARWLSLVPAAVLLLVAAGCSKPDTSTPASADTSAPATAAPGADVSTDGTTGPHIALTSKSVTGTTLTASYTTWGGVVNVVIADGTKKIIEATPVKGAVTLKVTNLSVGVHSTMSARGWTVPPGKTGTATAPLAIPSFTVSAAAPPPPTSPAAPPPPPSTTTPTTVPAPPPTTTPPATVPATGRGSNFGFSGSARAVDAGYVADLDRAAAAGVRSVARGHLGGVPR